MSGPILIELAVAGASLLGAVVLGYFLQRGCGVLLCGVSMAMAAALCIAATALGGWVGLLIAIVLVGILGLAAGRKFLSKSAGLLVVGLWLGYNVICLAGYLLGGAAGLVFISLPAVLLFWLCLYVFSGYMLPLREGAGRTLAFRSLLTFSLGTNYPYHVMKDRKLEERVPGNAYRSFLAGPGIVLTGCDHVVVLTDGTNVKVPEEPGLTFTDRFEVVQRVIDLRPQLRSFFVEARTLDGILTRVLTFIPFRINWGGQKPEMGRPFPFQRRAVFRAVTNELVEQQLDVKHDWDKQVEIVATRIMRDIICRYRFDDLCLALGPYVEGAEDIFSRYAADEGAFPQIPKRDPRYRIRDELVSRLKREMKPYGIEVIGGGISNLLPVDRALIQRRIDNWRTKWQSRIRAVEAESRATIIEHVDQSQAGVDQAMFLTIARLLSENTDEGRDISEEIVAATYVAALERMAENPNVSELIEPETHQRLAMLRPGGRPMLLSGREKGAGG